MEFKDRLKRLRTERHLSQQTLANAIFVSRSAVAKWENGLGLPSRASYEALLTYFAVAEEDFPLNEEEEAPSIEHNKKMHLIKSIVFWLCFAVMAVLPLWLTYAVTHGYGFSPEMAAGEYWCDEHYIETQDYRFYYDTYVDSQGEPLPMIYGFCAVKKLPVGYQKLDISEYKHVAYTADKKDEKWYTFPGKDGYHHFFVQTMIATPEEGLRLQIIDEIWIKEDVIPVLYNSYLTTTERITEFYLRDELYRIS